MTSLPRGACAMLLLQRQSAVTWRNKLRLHGFCDLPLMDLLHCCATNPGSNAAIFGWVCCNRSNRVKRKPVVARYARKASRVAAINITEFCNNVRAHRDSECKQKWMWAKPSDANLWSTWCQVCKQNKQQDSICKQSEPVMQMCDLVDASEDKNMRAQL